MKAKGCKFYPKFLHQELTFLKKMIIKTTSTIIIIITINITKHKDNLPQKKTFFNKLMKTIMAKIRAMQMVWITQWI